MEKVVHSGAQYIYRISLLIASTSVSLDSRLTDLRALPGRLELSTTAKPGEVGRTRRASIRHCILSLIWQ
jgi:hypothetical protein